MEWKSTIFTALQNNKIESGNFKKDNIKKISETIISMMNSEGGKIIIGYIEKPDLVLDIYKSEIIIKDKHHFFDLGVELIKFNYSLDKLNREIQDFLSNEIINQKEDYCNNFDISFIPVPMIENDFNIILITIKKCEKLLISRLQQYEAIFIRKRNGAKNGYEKPEICFNLLS